MNKVKGCFKILKDFVKCHFMHIFLLVHSVFFKDITYRSLLILNTACYLFTPVLNLSKYPAAYKDTTADRYIAMIG